MWQGTSETDMKANWPAAIVRCYSYQMIESIIEDFKQDLNNSCPGIREQGHQGKIEVSNQWYGRSRVKEYFFRWKTAELDIDPVRGYNEK